MICNSGFEVYSCSNQMGYKKGQFGVRAKRDYEAGEEIIREEPALRINSSMAASNEEEATQKFKEAVQNAFDDLSPTTAKFIMELSSCRQQDKKGSSSKRTPYGIFQTNSFQLEKNLGYGGIFLTIARMNHSCRPNAIHYWRPDLHMMVVHAGRDIAKGEEICICYGPSAFYETEGRRDYIRNKYFFHCICEMCQEGNTKGGDDRMAKIRAFHENISLEMFTRPEKVKEEVENCLHLLQEQRIGHRKGHCVAPVLHYGFQACMKLNNISLACSYLERELVSIRSSQGDDSYKALDIQNMLAKMKAC